MGPLCPQKRDEDGLKIFFHFKFLIYALDLGSMQSLGKFFFFEVTLIRNLANGKFPENHFRLVQHFRNFFSL